MICCDSQIHVFPPGSEERAARFGQRPVPVREILATMDGAGVERAVLVPANPDHGDANLEAARSHPGRFRSMGLLKLSRPLDEESFERWMAQGWAGVRLSFPPWQRESWLRDGTADWFWPLADTHQVPVMVWAPGQLGDVAEVARRYPDLRLAIDHLGLTVDDIDDAIDPVLDDLVALSGHPNISVKATSLPGHTTDSYPFASLHPRIQRVVEAFGPERVFWGSDLTRLSCPYAELVELFRSGLDFLTGPERDEILGAAVLRWLGWGS